MFWLWLISLIAISLAQQDSKELRPCFERYPNNRLVNVMPYHSEWRMKTEDMCLPFCASSVSRCRSVVFDSVQHICHYFSDDGRDVAVPAAKLIYLRVVSKECLEGNPSELEAPVEMAAVPESLVEPIAAQVQEQMESQMEQQQQEEEQQQQQQQQQQGEETDKYVDEDDAMKAMQDWEKTKTPETENNERQEESFGGSFEEPEKGIADNEIMRDLKPYEQPRWQSSMEQLEKNDDSMMLKSIRPSQPITKEVSREELHSKKAKLEQDIQARLVQLQTKFPTKTVEYIDEPEPEVTKAPRRRIGSARKIQFTEDMMYPKKISSRQEIRRKPIHRNLKPVSITPSFVPKALSFLETVNGDAEIEKEEISQSQQFQQEQISAKTIETDICSPGDSAVWVTFENSLDREQSSIDSSSATKQECEEMCNELGCKSYSFFEKEVQCMINQNSEGVLLKKAPKGDFSASTSTKFCFSKSLPIFKECTNFVGFRDFSLEVSPREQFDGLPTGYQGMQLCIELCVLSTEYTCRSASFLASEGRCLLNSENASRRPDQFRPTLGEDHLYFENGCSTTDEISAEESEALSISRESLPEKETSGLKSLHIKKINKSQGFRSHMRL